MTVHSLPLANAATIARSMEQNMGEPIAGNVSPGQLIDIVKEALALSRAVAEDGKGFTVSYVKGKRVVEKAVGWLIATVRNRRSRIWT